MKNKQLTIIIVGLMLLFISKLNAQRLDEFQIEELKLSTVFHKCSTKAQNENVFLSNFTASKKLVNDGDSRNLTNYLDVSRSIKLENYLTFPFILENIVLGIIYE